jgi:biopolymer transport protein ExbB
MVELFNKGGPFMWPLLAALVIGIAFILERLWTLTRASINAKNFFAQVEEALRGGGPDAAAEICSNTRGPVASVLHAGLLEMAFLERGMVWLATIANIAPLLGFLGTVSGMIKAFEAIALAGDVEPSLVASGISEALITTAAGLAIAIPIQAFHNYFVSRIDKIVIDMEESSAAFVDTLVEMGYGEEKGAA